LATSASPPTIAFAFSRHQSDESYAGVRTRGGMA
jgi:hypothetical protein